MNLQGSNTYNKVKNKNLQNTTQYTVRTVTKYNTGHCQNSYKIQQKNRRMRHNRLPPPPNFKNDFRNNIQMMIKNSVV